MRRAFASVTVPEACRLQAGGGRSSEDQVGAELEHTAVLKQRGCEPLCAVRDGEPPPASSHLIVRFPMYVVAATGDFSRGRRSDPQG